MGNTFTGETKELLCRTSLDKACDIRAEAYGFLLFATAFSHREIRHITESKMLARRVQLLFGKAFGLGVEMKRAAVNGKYVLLLEDRAQIGKVMGAFGLEQNRSALQINRALLEEECCRNAFLRGVFLASGTVAEPTRRYHLEIVTPHQTLCSEMTSLLLDMSLEPKQTERGAYNVLYFKQSERIEDFLTRIGAPGPAMQVMNAKVEKEVRNQINRQVNCEAANISKTSAASVVHCEAIRKLERSGELEKLPDELRHTAQLRMEHPEMSLANLASLFDPPLNRASLNYRLKRLVTLSETVQREEE